MLKRIDKFFTTLHQAVVETSQQKPVWWVRHCTYLMGIGTVASLCLSLQGDAPLFVIGLHSLSQATASVLLYNLSKSEASIASIGSVDGLRHMLIVLTALSVVMDLGESLLAYLLWQVYPIALFCCLYFAACKPPTPRKRQQAFKLNTGATS